MSIDISNARDSIIYAVYESTHGFDILGQTNRQKMTVARCLNQSDCFFRIGKNMFGFFKALRCGFDIHNKCLHIGGVLRINNVMVAFDDSDVLQFGDPVLYSSSGKTYFVTYIGIGHPPIFGENVKNQLIFSSSPFVCIITSCRIIPISAFRIASVII